MAEILNNLSAEVWTAIISFLSVYGGTLIAMVICFIRTRLKNINLEKTIDEMQQYCNETLVSQMKQTQEMLDLRLAEMEKQVLVKISDNEDSREQAITQASAEFEAALSELKTNIDTEV